MLTTLIRRTLNGAGMTCAALHDMLDRAYPLELIQHECASMIRAGTLNYRRNHHGLAEVYRPDAPPRPAGINAQGNNTGEPNQKQRPAPPRNSIKQGDLLRYIAAHPYTTNNAIAKAHQCCGSVVSSALNRLTHTNRVQGIAGTTPRQYLITPRGQRQLDGTLTGTRWTDNLMRSSRPQRIGNRNAVHAA